MGMMTQLRRWMSGSGKRPVDPGATNWVDSSTRLHAAGGPRGGLSEALGNDQASLRITVTEGLRGEGLRGEGHRVEDVEHPHGAREPKNKQDLINELRRHYVEVIELVRKVNTHLDTQEGRGERLASLASRVETAAASLPEIRTQSRELNGLVRELADSLRVYAGDISRARSTEHEILARLTDATAKIARTEEAIAQRVHAMSVAVEGVSSQAARIGDAVAMIAAKESQRDARIVETFEKTQRWLVMAVGVAIAGIVIAACVAALALT